MNTERKIAIVAGALFIVATAAPLIGLGFTGSTKEAPDQLVRVASNANGMRVGALLSFTGFAASAGIAIALYPVLKKHNPGLALGAVGFRLIEAVFYIVGALCLLALLPLSTQLASAAKQDTAYFQTLGHMLLTAHDLAGFVFAVLAFCIGGGLYYYVFFRTNLVPRWLSAWGLLALLALLSAVLITLFDGEPYSVSGNLTFLAAPIALQEMVLAVWLIMKGFNPSAIAARPADVAASKLLSAA
jgi:uncharacterized protein DUF4386